MGLSHLSLLQMSFSGAVFILVIILLRVMAINRLPKKMFLILWDIALLRLLVPLSIPSAVSVYSVISQTVDDNTLDQTPIRNIIPVVSSEQAESGDLVQTTVQANPLQESQRPQLQSPQLSQRLQQSKTLLSQQTQQSDSSLQSSPSEPMQTQQASKRTLPVSAWFVVWCTGMILCIVFFTTSYLRWYFKFCTSVPVHNTYVEQWLGEHRLQRPIFIRQSDRTATPLTYGVFRPVILLPNKTDWENTEQLRYILLHEYVHICRFDTVTKFITAIAVCIHWFNPLVWVMYVLFNRDLELSCDERVVRLLGIGSKSDYARVLISMEAKKSGLMPFYNNFSKNAIEERITSIMKTRKTSVLAIFAAVIVVGGLTAVFATSARTAKGEDEADAGADETSLIEDENNLNGVSENQDMANEADDLVINIQDFYTTNMGDPSNLYYIDENKVLWGCGRNNYGQLGQGTQDYDFHDEMVKIAENVIHVDYSQTGFTIYLTEDHKLYGMGNAGCGALQQYEQFDFTKMMNGENYTVTTPKLLMENVIYARCGNSDVACMDEDNNVWIWGTLGYDTYNSNFPKHGDFYFEYKPVKVLENAVLVTGGFYNHAALLADGSVWTWGYNYAGECGIPRKSKFIVEEPTRVAEDVVMVWTGTTRYNIDCQDISEFGGVYERQLENTIILKRDGSCWACGANVGTEEKVLDFYWESVDYPMVYSDEFMPYENPRAAFFTTYYNSVSDVDETSVYLGGAGGIYEINQSYYGTVYQTPHIAGAAVYKNYIYSIEYNVTDNGITAELIRIKKSGSDKEVLTQISTGSYDLSIIGNTLFITEQILGDYGLETIFYAYNLDDEGYLTSDTPLDAYSQFNLPDGYEDSMRFLINPWFSTKYFEYFCFTKSAGVMDINSIWISRGNQGALEEIVTCSEQPLLSKDTIFYCDSNEETLILRSLDSAQETVLYEIPDSDSLSLLNYDGEWVYFSERANIDERNELSSFVMRVNLQNHRTEQIYELPPNSYISNFNVYGNSCYFILSDADTTPYTQWIQYDLINGEVTTIDMDAPLEEAGTVSIIDGVTMEVTKVSNVSLTLLITNETDKNIQFGDDYYLEGRDRDSGKWSRLSPIIDNGMFYMVAYMLQDNSTANQDVNFEWLYGKLEPGKYRIVKEITDFRGTGDYTNYTYMAEFDVD